MIGATDGAPEGKTALSRDWRLSPHDKKYLEKNSEIGAIKDTFSALIGPQRPFYQSTQSRERTSPDLNSFALTRVATMSSSESVHALAKILAKVEFRNCEINSDPHEICLSTPRDSHIRIRCLRTPLTPKLRKSSLQATVRNLSLKKSPLPYGMKINHLPSFFSPLFLLCPVLSMLSSLCIIKFTEKLSNVTDSYNSLILFSFSRCLTSYLSDGHFCCPSLPSAASRP
eukprot:g62521.t1